MGLTFIYLFFRNLVSRLALPSRNDSVKTVEILLRHEVAVLRRKDTHAGPGPTGQ